MQSDMLVLWRDRIKRDRAMIDDVVWAQTGVRLEDRYKTAIEHQLERLVLDVVVLTRQEEAKKG